MSGFFSGLFKAGPKSDEAVLDILKRVPIFEGLSARELSSVERIMHRREYLPEEAVIHQDSAGFGMYIIVKGTVDIIHEPAGQVIATLHDGEFLGELSLLDNSPRSATVIAKTHCKMLGFFQPDLFGLIEHDPRLGVKIVSRLSGLIGDRLRKSNEQVQALQIELGELKAKQ